MSGHGDGVAVIGGGTMGAGIAALACCGGFSTVLCEVDDRAADAAAVRVGEEVERLVRRGRLETEAALRALDRLRTTSVLDPVADSGLAIEVVPERLALKRELLSRLARAAPQAVLATNTSSIPIGDIAKGVGCPERVLGLHFFNPAASMPLVELIPTPATSPENLALARAVAEAMGKQVVVAADGPGFLVNRCARPYYLEALRIVEAGTATPSQVDEACEREGGFPMGPFRLMDLIGLDVSLAATRSMWERSGQEPRWQPSPIQESMVAAGRLGRKSGGGFYGSGGEVAWGADAQAAVDGEEILMPLIAQLVNEAWFALEARVASREDIDRAMTLGLGHPCGPLRWGEEVGLKRIVALLDRLAGPGRDPCYRVAADLRLAAAANAGS